ncbi:MAG: hypothetical protein K0S61_1936 [Anaerocolumna sp.]|jgi:hypothetical protein|nr:hypothetical protein [Anaerocolumna sp.]
MMKSIIIRILPILMIIFLLIGCTSNNTSDSTGNAAAYNQEENDKSQVIVKGYYDEPSSIRDKETVMIKGVSEGEFVEISVLGKIRDFEHLRLEWDGTKNDLVEKDTLNKFDILTNQIIVISTYIPDGIPSEKIKWKSVKGKSYEYIIQEYSLDDENNAEQIFILE